MKRVLVALLVSAVLPGISAAQQSGGRLAADGCYYDWWGDDVYVYTCRVYAFDREGRQVWLDFGFDPALSPDGTRIAYVTGDTSSGYFNPIDIVVMDLRDRSVRNLTANDAVTASTPAWSRDGHRIAFQSRRSGTLELYVMNADGTGLTQVTNGVGFLGRPSWAPDDRIAFECTGETGGQNLCSIRSDGTEFRRLTSSQAVDAEPAFSPDGTQIAFVTNRFGSTNTLAMLDADGTVTNLGGWTGNAPTWSPDGRQLAFYVVDGGVACPADGSFCQPGYASMYTMTLADAAPSFLTGGANPSWAESPTGGFPPDAVFTVACTFLTCMFDGSQSLDEEAIVNYAWRFDDGTTATGVGVLRTYPRGGSYTVELTVVDAAGLRDTYTRMFDVTDSAPIASFTRECSGSICRFDASASSDSDGHVVSYAWSFGDGTTGTTSDPVVTHSYAPGTYTATLIVSDNAGAISAATSVQIIAVNIPPVATFEFSCDLFTPVCAFNEVASDPDGTIVSWTWNFGDGTQWSGRQVTHTYPAAGIYTVTLTVCDNYGATSTRALSVTVFKVALHIADLDGTKDVQRRYWTVFVNVTIHDSDHRPFSAVVDGVWSTGEPGSCWADSSGVCTVTTTVPLSTKSVTFTVQNIRFNSAIYDAARNHDVDGNTNGTGITVTRR